jgi:hypothetical protein
MKNKSKNIIALAVSGLVAGSLMASNAFADHHEGHEGADKGEHADKDSCKGGEKDSCKGHEKAEKDSCKGKEGCGAKE